MKKEINIIGIGILTAFTTSLCCIVPLVTIVSGIAGVGSAFSWLAPLRPYLICISILTLGFAWYQKLIPKKQTDCSCDTGKKPKFISTKAFLAIVTIFAVLTTTFPYYSYIFFPQKNTQLVLPDKPNLKTVDVKISGMTCKACEHEIRYEVDKLPGIIHSEVSYKHENAVIQFDSSVTTINQIEAAINLTGNKIKEFNYIN